MNKFKLTFPLGIVMFLPIMLACNSNNISEAWFEGAPVVTTYGTCVCDVKVHKDCNAIIKNTIRVDDIEIPFDGPLSGKTLDKVTYVDEKTFALEFTNTIFADLTTNPISTDIIIKASAFANPCLNSKLTLCLFHNQINYGPYLSGGGAIYCFDIETKGIVLHNLDEKITITSGADDTHGIYIYDTSESPLTNDAELFITHGNDNNPNTYTILSYVSDATEGYIIRFQTHTASHTEVSEPVLDVNGDTSKEFACNVYTPFINNGPFLVDLVVE